MEKFLADISNVFQYGLVNFDLRDAIDVFVIAAFMYAALLLLKRAQSYFIFVGIAILFAVYLAARFFNLYLTSLILQSLFSSFVVMLVVVFQRELRQFFEWLSMVGKSPWRKREKISETVEDDVVKTVTYLIKKKTGALIVFAGRDHFERVLQGGVQLDGKVSVPLLLSIFDPTSPGHDGAVVIEGDKIKEFGVFLPLAEKFNKSENFGTRHLAALGLSRRSDAFVVAVSEERGTVSLAYRGELRTLSGPEELKTKLHAFLEETFVPRETRWHSWITKNFRIKIVALAFAVLFWFVFVFQLGTVNRQFSVPIEFRFLPSEFVVDQLAPEEITVTFGGREPDFRLLQPRDLKISINLSGAGEGWKKTQIKENFINRPPQLSIINFSPKAIDFHISKTSQ